MRRTIDEATARRLAVAANCDPRTIKKVLRGAKVRPGVAQRARQALVSEGLLAR